MTKRDIEYQCEDMGKKIEWYKNIIKRQLLTISRLEEQAQNKKMEQALDRLKRENHYR